MFWLERLGRVFCVCVFVCACCLRYCSFNFAFAYARASTSWELDVAFCCLPAMTIAYSQSQFWLPVDYIDQEIVGAYVQHVYLCKLPCESVAHAYVHTHTRVQVYASAQYTRFIAVRRVRSFAPANIKRVFYATHIAFRFGSAIVLGNAKKKHRQTPIEIDCGVGANDSEEVLHSIARGRRTLASDSTT